MKNLLFTIAFLFTTSIMFAQSSVYVSGYIKSNGTYVQPHYRSAPNNTVYDNYSKKGNINPYTGTVGTKSIYSNYFVPSYSAPSYSVPTYSAPRYSMPSYSAPSYSYPNVTSYNVKSIYTGPRGGQYYINSNGNKTYVRN